MQLVQLLPVRGVRLLDEPSLFPHVDEQPLLVEDVELLDELSLLPVELAQLQLLHVSVLVVQPLPPPLHEPLMLP